MDRGSSLQESDLMFWQHSLTVKHLQKVRSDANRVIVGRCQDRPHAQKNALFDVLSLTNKLYQSKSTNSSGPGKKTYYFSKNTAPNLINKGLTQLLITIRSYNALIRKHTVVVGPLGLAKTNELLDDGED